MHIAFHLHDVMIVGKIYLHVFIINDKACFIFYLLFYSHRTMGGRARGKMLCKKIYLFLESFYFIKFSSLFLKLILLNFPSIVFVIHRDIYKAILSLHVNIKIIHSLQKCISDT